MGDLGAYKRPMPWLNGAPTLCADQWLMPAIEEARLGALVGRTRGDPFSRTQLAQAPAFVKKPAEATLGN
jgi:hypothetical protein